VSCSSGGMGDANNCSGSCGGERSRRTSNIIMMKVVVVVLVVGQAGT